MKKTKELSSLSKQELEAKMKELNFELLKLNSQVATKASMKNSKQIGNIKKNVARIITLLKSKEGNKKA